MTDEPAEMKPEHRPALLLKSQKFREARQGDWKALNNALDKVEKKGVGSFSIDELLNLPLLYRSAMSSLSMAQSISLDRNLITYLQGLCVRAYVYVYGPQTRMKDVLSGYFVRDWPQGLRRLWPELLLSLAITVAGAALGWLLCAHDQSWYSIFLPGEDRSPTATIAYLRSTLGATLGDGSKGVALSPFAVFLMSHNIKVAIMAFAFGIIFGLPTFVLLLQNGITLGAMLWLFYTKGLGFEFTAWLSIHGTTELSAIVIAGACGFHIARRLMFPGMLTRQAAMSQAGRLAGTVMIGVALMLTVAGCLEGVGRQMITNPFARLSIGLAMFILWAVYFTYTGRKQQAAALAGIILAKEERMHGQTQP